MLAMNSESNKSSSNSGNNNDGSLKIVSIAESRARVVTICKIECSHRSQMEIYLLSDAHSYVDTILTLEDIAPDEILLSDSSKSSVLSKKIENFSKLRGLKVIYINRQYFDQDLGADILKRIVVGKCDSDLITKYTVLAASYCLIRYIGEHI